MLPTICNNLTQSHTTAILTPLTSVYGKPQMPDSPVLLLSAKGYFARRRCRRRRHLRRDRGNEPRAALLMSVAAACGREGLFWAHFKVSPLPFVRVPRIRIRATFFPAALHVV